MRPIPSKSPRTRRRWPAAIAAAALSLLVAELLLRALDLPPTGAGRFRFVSRALDQSIFEPNATLFWRLKPAADVNRFHLRGYQPDQTKRERDFRVACVGDSVTYALNESVESAFGMQLERLLQQLAPAARVETVLAGLPGYTTYQDRVLYQQSLLDYAPDLTILYCGAWNDFMPAIDDGDEGLAALPDRYSLRLAASVAQLWRMWRRPSSAAIFDPVRMVELARLPEPPRGRRVPLDRFLHNVSAIMAMAAQSGTVVVVVPALLAGGEQAVPIALQYRRELEQLARAHGAIVVDALDAVRRYERSLPPGATCGKRSLCLQDWVHLTAAGHALVARRIFDAVRSAPPPRLAELLLEPRSGPELPQVERLQPTAVAALDSTPVMCAGAGFRTRAPIDRIWVGGRAVPRFRVIDDEQLELSTPAFLTPGTHAIELITARGCSRPDVMLEVKPCALAASLCRRGSGYQLQLAGHAAIHRRIVLWISMSGIAREPIATQFGPLWLPGRDPRPADRPDLPFCFDQLPHYSLTAYTGESNTWRAEMSGVLPAAELPAIAVQGVVYLQNGRVGAVTEPVRLNVVR
ncbi:MAG: SGNH/GDSL hydrolase family protein [Planctomycetota bacterium]